MQRHSKIRIYFATSGGKDWIFITSFSLLLLSLFNKAFVKANQPILRWKGFFLDDRGQPVSNGHVQIWHTDSNGVYDHPLFPGFANNLDPGFQYYGTASVDDVDGSFEFETIRPGLYFQRPITHIHVRAFVDRNEKLTTQLYFADEGPDFPDALILDLESNDGSGYETTQKNLTVDLGGGGNFEITPSQQSGPFYPIEDFFHLGSDLVLSTDSPAPTKSPAPTGTHMPTFLCQCTPNLSTLYTRIISSFKY